MFYCQLQQDLIGRPLFIAPFQNVSLPQYELRPDFQGTFRAYFHLPVVGDQVFQITGLNLFMDEFIISKDHLQAFMAAFCPISIGLDQMMGQFEKPVRVCSSKPIKVVSQTFVDFS